MKPRFALLLFILIVSSRPVHGQLPNTQLYTLDLKLNELKVVLENPKWLTSFNTEGYNNQPHFINPDELLFTSSWKARGLTDVYKFDLSSGLLTRLTATEESEYSPTVSLDGDHFNVVRQELEEGGKIPQVLWEYPDDLSNFGKALTDKYDNIGYFRFIDHDNVALFLVGPPNKLVIFNLKEKKEKFIAYNIGRTFKKDGEGHLIYVQKIGNTYAMRKYHLANEISQLVTYTLEGQEDFDILPNGDFIAGQGAKLYRFSMANKDGWQEIFDLTSSQIANISRISTTTDKIAFVASR